jgi:hypothetical protein
MKSRTLTRLVTTTLLALVLSSVALVTSAQGASALSTIADANVEYGNNNCGDPILGAPVIGTVRFLRSGNQLMLRYVMVAGDANTQYSVHLFDADTCASLGKVASFTTDAAGVGRSTSRPVLVGGSTRFYAIAFDTSNFVGLTHASLAVDLP